MANVHPGLNFLNYPPNLRYTFNRVFAFEKKACITFSSKPAEETGCHLVCGVGPDCGSEIHVIWITNRQPEKLLEMTFATYTEELHHDGTVTIVSPDCFLIHGMFDSDSETFCLAVQNTEDDDRNQYQYVIEVVSRVNSNKITYSRITHGSNVDIDNVLKNFDCFTVDFKMMQHILQAEGRLQFITKVEKVNSHVNHS